MNQLRRALCKLQFSSMNQNFKHTLVSIEGNIGSGKSTLLRLMKEKYVQFKYIDEPVQEWQNINGNTQLNLLQNFYNEPHRWAYTMQVYAFYSRLKHWKSILDMYIQKITNINLRESQPKTILSERSIQADKQIFAINGYQSGLMNELEFALYDKFYDWLVNEVFGKQINKQLIIYLKTHPEICFARLHKRGRKEEKVIQNFRTISIIYQESIQLDYLKQLQSRHEEWLNNGSLKDKNLYILPIDGNIEFESNEARQNAIFKEIEIFLLHHQVS